MLTVVFTTLTLRLMFSSVDKEIRMANGNLKTSQTGDNCVHEWRITVVDSSLSRSHKIRSCRVQTRDLINL